MIAQIIVSTNPQTIEEQALSLLEKSKLVKNHADVLWLEGEKLGAEQAKNIREFLSLKPYQASLRAVVVMDAENFTPDAQNALLKTLEEPSGENLILFGVPQEDSLLPTIISRCHVIFVQQTGEERKKNSKYDKKIEELITTSIDKRFQIIEKIDDKKEFLNVLTHYFREQTLFNPSPQQAEILKEFVQAEKWAKQNVNMRAILEYLCLKF